MNPISQDRADSVWRSFAGMYGGDAVDRKYGPKPPPEWVSAISGLKDHELQRGMRRIASGGKPHVPTLPEFLTACRRIGDDQEFGGQKQTQALTHEATITDPWGAVANQHLLAYTLKHAAQFAGGKPDNSRKRWLNCRTQILVRWKNEWARLMREADEADREPQAQRNLWAACMAQAEDEIERTPAAHREAA